MTATEILVVDDDRDFAQALGDRLATRDFQAAIAFDGDAAIAKAREQEYDVIILDVANRTIHVYNLVLNSLDDPENYEELKALLRDAARAR